MPGYTRIQELQLRLSRVEREIDRLDDILGNIGALQGIWQDIFEEIERLLNA